MSKREDLTLSHLYGLGGFIPGLIGLLISFKAPSPWSEFALCASGWVVAVMYAFLLLKCFHRAREDGLELGKQGEVIADLRKELVGRNATLDYIAGLQISAVAQPRSMSKNESPAKPISNPGEPAND